MKFVSKTLSGTGDPLVLAEQEKIVKICSRTFVVGGIASGIASLFDSSSGLFTAWDNYLTAIITVVCIVAGVMIHFRPERRTSAVLLALIPITIYQQGVMYLAVHQPSVASLYSASSSGPFFPLVLIVMFITLPKGASLLSSIHCAGFYLQFLVNTFWLSEQSPLPGRLEGEHLLVEAMLAYPVYVVALNYIVKLRERLHVAQEESFKQKETFLGMLSHEVRNQMQTMVGAIELLDLKLTDPAERRSVRRLQAATTQLQTYMSDINELTTLENPTLKVEKKAFDVARLLNDINDEWLPYAQSHGLDLRVSAPLSGGGQSMMVDTDESRLRQVIANLISNAIKYTAAGGVTISANACCESPGCFKVEVADTGIGIDEKHLGKIFLPHVRLENALGHQVPGSGLGLAIVKRLVESLGGTVEVESQLQRGTKFRVIVPGLVNV